MPTQAKPTEKAISHLLHDEKQLHAPENLKRETRLRDFDAECKRAAEDPDAFWAEIARELHWHEPWSKVFDWKYPTFEWFIGGRCNITYNYLDRQGKAGKRKKVAYIFTNQSGHQHPNT